MILRRALEQLRQRGCSHQVRVDDIERVDGGVRARYLRCDAQLAAPHGLALPAQLLLPAAGGVPDSARANACNSGRGGGGNTPAEAAPSSAAVSHADATTNRSPACDTTGQNPPTFS